MKSSLALTLILLFVVLGGLLSGYLSYVNLFANGCGQTIISCGVNPVYIVGLPNCVYGFAMYVAIGILSAIYWVKGSSKGIANALVWLGLVGTLFALSLSVYELWLAAEKPESLPACVYGFFFYLGIFVVSLLLRRNEMRKMQTTV
ncbi:MAG: hypothetical protein H6760_02760 [Candidatus Nomurabacteria bacterium]|nr:MAG: hypothetical protein H6760_02760 [Candidatus Nomurabacteria bacterium]